MSRSLKLSFINNSKLEIHLSQIFVLTKRSLWSENVTLLYMTQTCEKGNSSCSRGHFHYHIETSGTKNFVLNISRFFVLWQGRNQKTTINRNSCPVFIFSIQHRYKVVTHSFLYVALEIS